MRETLRGLPQEQSENREAPPSGERRIEPAAEAEQAPSSDIDDSLPVLDEPSESADELRQMRQRLERFYEQNPQVDPLSPGNVARLYEEPTAEDVERTRELEAFIKEQNSLKGKTGRFLQDAKAWWHRVSGAEAREAEVARRNEEHRRSQVRKMVRDVHAQAKRLQHDPNRLKNAPDWNGELPDASKK